MVNNLAVKKSSVHQPPSWVTSPLHPHPAHTGSASLINKALLFLLVLSLSCWQLKISFQMDKIN